MFKRLREFLLLTDRDKQRDIRQAKLVKSVSLGVMGITFIGGLIEIVFLPDSLPYLAASLIIFLIFLVSFLLARYQLIRGASLFLVISLWLVTTYINFFVEASGIFGFSGYIIVLFLANLLFNERIGLLFFVLIVAINFGALVADVTGIVEFTNQSANDQVSPEAFWVTQAVLFFFFALLIRLAFQTLEEAVDFAQSKEQQLEKRVVQIKTAAEVARDASAVREMDQLLNRAVDLICERFGFYYAAIYLVDDLSEYAVIKSAKGEPGRELLKIGYKLRVGKEGMIGYVAKTGEARIVVDVEKDDVHFKNPLLPHTRSEMCLPLTVKQRVVGVLDVQSDTLGAFSEEDVEVLQTLSDQLAVAYETARLFEAAQRQLRELTVLHTVALATTQSASEDSLIERVTQIIGDAFYPDNFGIILVDDAEGKLKKHPSYRERVEDANTPYPIGVGVTGMVAKEGKSRRINDTSKELAYMSVDPGTCSELCVPIKMGERVVGVLNTESTRINAYTEADERLLATVAGHLALALENAQLFTNLQNHTKELIQALSRLQEMDQVKNEFIQNVSHELRTPLAVVLGYGELLESGELGDLKPEQLGSISIIVRRLRGLSMILEDFLIILEVETYDQPFEFVDLTQLLNKTLADLEGIVAQAGIQLEKEFDLEIPKIHGITNHLRRVIENLVGNALKFTPTSGSIKVTLEKSGTEVVLKVADTGIGITPEQLPRVFERFYQVDGTSTRRYGGIGLGLALVKEVIEAHKGNVTVESQVGRGSTVLVTLPIEIEA